MAIGFCIYTNSIRQQSERNCHGPQNYDVSADSFREASQQEVDDLQEGVQRLGRLLVALIKDAEAGREIPKETFDVIVEECSIRYAAGKSVSLSIKLTGLAVIARKAKGLGQ